MFADLANFCYAYDVGAMKLHRVKRGEDVIPKHETDLIKNNRKLLQWGDS